MDKTQLAQDALEAAQQTASNLTLAMFFAGLFLIVAIVLFVKSL